jgi:FkbM family methyltransferase
MNRLRLANEALIREAKRLLCDQRRAFPAGLVLSAVVSVTSRKPCRVRHRDGYWEYRWRAGTSFIHDPKVFVTPVDPTGAGEIYFWEYEPRADDVVVDIGAGLGAELLALRMRVGPHGRVFGFEAHPATFARLSQLCEMNRWSNVEAIHAAVVDQTKPVAISDSEDYQVNNVFSSGDNTVDGITLDDFVANQRISHIDYLYMNIEGAERLAIQGMDRVAQITDHMCISCHDFLGTEWGRTNEDVRAWLTAKGFRVLGRPDHPKPPVRFFVYGSKL